MPPAAVLPAIALIAGAAGGAAVCSPPPPLAPWGLAALVGTAAIAWRRGAHVATMLCVCAGFACAGLALGARDCHLALATPLRAVLDREFGGFALGATATPGRHDPVPTRLRVLDDAVVVDGEVALRARVVAVRLRGKWTTVDGGVVVSVGGVSVGGESGQGRAGQWRASRTIEAPVTYRRPARYRDAGVGDFERQAAIDGVTLLGSIKSGLLVTVVDRGPPLAEMAARVRAHVRRTLTRRVAPQGPVSSAIVAAVLIGDRTGLPDEVRARLQAAGTYHVIAISGGNIAVLASLLTLAFAAAGVSGRWSALATLVGLAAYAAVVLAGPSVWRATLVAGVYLLARLFDHRTAPAQSMGVAAMVIVCGRPLDVGNAGFILTFGATAALLVVAGGGPRASGLAGWLLTSVLASAAVEAALLPVMASAFSRVTGAGLFLNIVAVPLMAVVQVAGFVVVLADAFDPVARLAAWVAHLSAAGIVESARVVDVVPWVTTRVPPPATAVVLAYYLGWGALAWTATRHAPAPVRRRWVRLAGGACILLSAAAIVVAPDWQGLVHRGPAPARLRLTMLDVGQGDALALQLPGGEVWMVDAGGSPFGGGLDIGGRVVEPALWAAGVRAIGAMLLTHGDPDHIGGAGTLIADLRPRVVWQGVPVARAPRLQTVLALASAAHIPIQSLTAGTEMTRSGVRVVVLHPPAPDWDRPRVRNDDSVVLEIIYGDVGLLLTGDVSAEVERAILPRIVPVRRRILKVAHHGSRTSTSQALLDAWRPEIALISCGRGNVFGHPAPEVVARLAAAGARLYRTDRDGEITVDTDGRAVRVTTFTP